MTIGLPNYHMYAMCDTSTQCIRIAMIDSKVSTATTFLIGPPRYTPQGAYPLEGRRCCSYRLNKKEGCGSTASFISTNSNLKAVSHSVVPPPAHHRQSREAMI
jgi:hypothetical protein